MIVQEKYLILESLIGYINNDNFPIGLVWKPDRLLGMVERYEETYLGSDRRCLIVCFL
jgi:hypothetical protein